MTNLKKTVLYAIIPAVIAGLFSFAPKLYDLITVEKAELTYNITDGPALEDGNNFKKIYSITILNNGKKTLSNIQAELLTDGKIEKIQIQDSSGLKPSITETSKSLSIAILKLHPKENLGISAMLQVPNSSNTIEFNLRSDEIVGSANISPEEEEKRSKKTDMLGAILASVSVFLMVILVFSGKSSFLKRLSRHGDREDNLYYIALRLNIYELKEEIYKSNNKLTYMRASDFLMQIGKEQENNKDKCIRALKCLLLIGNIASWSKLIIKRNLKELDNTIDDKTIAEIEKVSKKISGIIDMRDEIDKSFIN